MERQIWKTIVKVMREVDKSKFNPKAKYDSQLILKVWFWAVLHDRPISWAVRNCNWPPHDQKWAKPSNTTMSRRLRSSDVKALLHSIEQCVISPQQNRDPQNLLWFIDGKPLIISGCSKDKQAGYGRAIGGKAKGYKLHTITGSDGSIAHWRVTPMNKDERTMAKRMLKPSGIRGYIVADGNYDSNKLHQICDENGNLQLVCPRRYGPNRGLGKMKHAAGRLRSKEILENPDPKFGNGLLFQRNEIERSFANLTNWGGGLTHLPPWARTYRRVHRWVQAGQSHEVRLVFP